MGEFRSRASRCSRALRILRGRSHWSLSEASGCEKAQMAVTRIVANLAAPDPTALARFYAQVFELELSHDMGWIAFLEAVSKSVSLVSAL